jgi:hypothetical protein
VRRAAGSAWAGRADLHHEYKSAEQVLVLHRWRGVEEHRRLAVHGEPKLEEFYRAHCSAPREISDYTPLPVDVNHCDGEPASVRESDFFGIGFLEPLLEWLPHRET